MLLCRLSTLFFDSREQALDLPVGRAQAAGLNQVLQGSMELSEWGETKKKQNVSFLEDEMKTRGQLLCCVLS